jgi:hypothetical protein
MSKSRATAIVLVIAEILWRSFGLFMKYLPTGLIIGLVATTATQNYWLLFISILGSFIPALLEAYSEIGEEIARTAKVTDFGINRGFNKAIRLIEDKEKEVKDKNK